MARLIVLNPEFSQQSCELPDGRITVGRSSGNMLVISDSSVSSEHCELLVDGPEVIVREVGSRNGTFVNGLRIQAQAGAKHGQIIRLGKIDLRLDLGGEEETSDATGVTAVFVLDSKKAVDRARPKAATFHHTFAPIGDAIPESMTMFMPKVRDEPLAPEFSIPELKKPETKKKSILVPVAIVLAIGLVVIGISIYLANR